MIFQMIFVHVVRLASVCDVHPLKVGRHNLTIPAHSPFVSLPNSFYMCLTIVLYSVYLLEIWYVSYLKKKLLKDKKQQILKQREDL